MVFEQKCTESKELNHVAIQRKLTPGTGSKAKTPGNLRKGKQAQFLEKSQPGREVENETRE